MTSEAKNQEDRRVKRTKAQVFEAFFQMVQSSRYDEMKVVDIIKKSGVGKSTFYEHFNGKDDVLSQSLENRLSVFANVLTGDGDDQQIFEVLDHFWDKRVFARVILQAPTSDVVDRCLRVLILSRLHSRSKKEISNQYYAISCFLSSGFLTLLTEWLLGRIDLSMDEFLVIIRNFSNIEIR